jgi:glycosyltransferase involved in cell wall biosynthesis
MKVLLVSHGYPPIGVAGVERLSAQTAEELTRRGHEVTVLTRQVSPAPTTLALRRDYRAGVPVASIVGLGAPVGSFPGDEAVLKGIFERMLVELSPDVVLITHLMHHSPGYVEIAQRWNVPVMLELHDFYMLCPRAHLQRVSGELCGGPEGGLACARHCFPEDIDGELRWALRSRSFADALAAADTVLAPSRYVVDAFAERRGRNRPIEIVANAVADLGPVLRTPPVGGTLRLASVGVTVEHKGFGVVVEAIRRAGVPSVSYTILGIPLAPLAEEMQRSGDAIPGLELRLAGPYAPSHLPALLAEADVLVVPSIVPETFSIVIREGFACGMPVIASRIGAMPDAIRPGDNGWLFEPGDATGLALLLHDLHENPALIERAKAGIRPTDFQSVAARTDRVEAMLTELTGSRHAGEAAAAPESEVGLMREALAAADAREAAEGGAAA